VASTKHLSNQAFLARVREYLPLGATVGEIDAAGRLGRNALEGGLNENSFYLFDGEAACAVGHAIADLALDEAKGTFLAGIQHFKNLDPFRECFEQLAITLDRVEIVAAGPMPREARRFKFIPVLDLTGACRDFWVALYQGKRAQAMLIGRQSKNARAFEEKQFIGFYTFNAGLIARLRQEFLDLARGRCSAWREFLRLQAIDQASKQLDAEFGREKQAVDQAMRRMQLDGQRYGAGHFASDLEQGLARLHKWKTRMPEILARAEGR